MPAIRWPFLQSRQLVKELIILRNSSTSVGLIDTQLNKEMDGFPTTNPADVAPWVWHRWLSSDISLQVWKDCCEIGVKVGIKMVFWEWMLLTFPSAAPAGHIFIILRSDLSSSGWFWQRNWWRNSWFPADESCWLQGSFDWHRSWCRYSWSPDDESFWLFLQRHQPIKFSLQSCGEFLSSAELSSDWWTKLLVPWWWIPLTFASAPPTDQVFTNLRFLFG